MSLLDKAIAFLDSEAENVAINEKTGQIVFTLSQRLVVSYHPEKKNRLEKLLIVDTAAGAYMALSPVEMENLYSFLGQIMTAKGVD